MIDDFGSLGIRERERQKRRQRRRHKTHDRKDEPAQYSFGKPNRFDDLLVDDPLDEYLEYYLPRHSRIRGRTRIQKRKLYRH